MAFRSASRLRSGALAASVAAPFLIGPAGAQPAYPEPTPEEMADALVKNEEVTEPLLFSFMLDRARAQRCGFGARQNPTGKEGLAVLRRCLAVRKLGCRSASRGYICDFRMVLGVDGWEDVQDPGKGRFFKDSAGNWAASGG